jgi:hypothetical protein
MSVRSVRSSLCPWIIACALLVVAAPAVGQTQGTDQPSAADQTIRAESFVTPPGGIAEAVLAPRYRNVTLTEASPDKSRFLNEIGDGPIGMALFSKPFHELGGLFVDWRANRNRSLTIRNSAGLEIISAADGSVTPLRLPEGLRVSDATWSPDGGTVAFFGHLPDGTYLWAADAATGRARQITRAPVLATLFTSFGWTPDSRSLVAMMLPQGRGPMPVAPAVPAGPQVKLAEETDKNRLRTYASLMATPHDQALLAWHVTGQVALIDVRSGRVTPIGQPVMVRDIDVAPDGRHRLVTRVV